MTVRIFERYPVSSRMIGYPASVRMFYQKVRIRSDICFIINTWSNMWMDTQYPVKQLAGYPISGIRSNIWKYIRHPVEFWLDVLCTVGYFVPLSSPSYIIFKGECLWTWDKKNKINVENVLNVQKVFCIVSIHYKTF